MILIIFGSILNLVVCLIGEVLYRNIKQCKKLRFWIPVFIGIAVIYILILFLFTITGAYSSSLITPIIMGSLAFYLVRRKILLTSNNESYVNKLSIWTAYYIFCLVYIFVKIWEVPYVINLRKQVLLKNDKNKLRCYKNTKFPFRGTLIS